MRPGREADVVSVVLEDVRECDGVWVAADGVGMPSVLKRLGWYMHMRY